MTTNAPPSDAASGTILRIAALAFPWETGAVDLINGDEPTEMLLLQGRPIGEPVTQYGSFV